MSRKWKYKKVCNVINDICQQKHVAIDLSKAYITKVVVLSFFL